MKTTILEEAQNIKVHFHIGRGGRFFNSGHKTYKGEVRALSDCFGDSTIICEDENGKPLPDSEWQLMDSGGNLVLTGRDEIEAETGILDWDGEYDTDIVRHLSECDDDEYQLILDAAERGEYVKKVVLAYACSALGKLMATSIKVDSSTMEVHTQEYECTILQRDDYSSYTEDEVDEVRDLLEEEGFISESIDKIIEKMEDNEWFKYDEE